MANVRFIGLETTTALVYAYETLALKHQKIKDIAESDVKMGLAKSVPANIFYGTSLALIILNASILEGSMRSTVSGDIHSEIAALTEEGAKAGRTGPTKPEALLSKYSSDIEMQGGWEKLKEQFAFYYDLSFDKIFTAELKEPLEILFVLRNVLAHGTAIIQPSQKMDDTMRDLYPFNWQRRLQSVNVYLEKQFGKGDLFRNLGEYALPAHFHEVTKKAFLRLIEVFPKSNAMNTFKMMAGYSFGYRL